MSHPILYLGDTRLDGAAGYLACLMHHFGWGFDYLPSDHRLSATDLAPQRKLLILSDYPAAHFAPALQEQAVQRIRAGMGLLMIGGWESFCGKGGDWAGTPIAGVLPVVVSRKDDRINCDQPALVMQAAEHPITRGLPLEDRPPTVGGFNAFTPRPGSTTVLDIERYRAWRSKGRTNFDVVDRQPLLVVGQHGTGRTAALGTDVAPHWVGGLVDWGGSRVEAQAPDTGGIEVGNLYATLLRQLLAWTGQL